MRSRRIQISIAAIVLAATIGKMEISRSPVSRPPSHPLIFDQEGSRIFSLFAGRQPVAGLSVDSRRLTPRPESRGFRVMSVCAATCSASDCSGHWMGPETRDCAGGRCGDGTYEYYVSEPHIYFYSNGYRYTGGTVCNGCRCAEEGCNW